MAAGPTITLTTRIADVPGVPVTRARAMEELGVRNVGQLVAYLPMRHERLRAEAPIAELLPGAIVTARGTVTNTRVVTRGARPRFEVAIEDETGRLDVVFFGQVYLRHTIQPGVELRVQGKATKRRVGAMQLANPKHWVLTPEREGDAPAEGERIRPVYPASSALSSRHIEKAVGRVLTAALPLIEDHLPAELRASRDLPELRTAYRMIHQPESEAEAAHARRRLVYDEFLLLQLGLAMRRAQRRGECVAPALAWSAALDRRIRERLPFRLTPEQDSVVAEVIADLTRTVPANRLIQGDVGSGKTAVAVYAMLMAAAAGHQGVLMAPTEILAEQHFESISTLLAGSKVTPALVTGRLTEAERRGVEAGLADGRVKVAVGTHALLSESVAFASLAVAVIDEQHRFGVHQRAGLRTKGVGATARGGPAEVPHVLVMTATPIPRTLAMTIMGDLDVSVIAKLPPGRQPVSTRVVDPARLDEVWAFVRARVQAGEQAYVVAPTIDGAPEPGLYPEVAPGVPPAGVRDLATRLSAGPMQGLDLGMVHSRLGPEEREWVMAGFRAGRVKVLVATTVIEVGVDVPRATVMVVLDADRFGLAQLHQLRGRVGRGGAKSACIVVPTPGMPVNERLAALANTPDGFELAELDLRFRGFGSMLGTEQSGMPPFRVGDPLQDQGLLELARRDASAWIARSPKLDGAGEQLVRRRLLRAHGAWIGLADVG